MFIELQKFQGGDIILNYHNVIFISKDVNSFAVFKMIDGVEIKTQNTYDSVLKKLRMDSTIK